MKKIFLSIIFFALLMLTGCGIANSPVSQTKSIDTLVSWSFQYNEGTNDYSLFFGLKDKREHEISADVDVDIRIESEKGTVVYDSTKSVTSDDFSTYTSKAAGEQYLAEIRIPKKDIAKGESTSGTVYLTVHKDGVVAFDEVNCKALYCLPVADVKVETGKLPVEIAVKGYDGRTESKIRIDKIEYEYKTDLTPTLKITVYGTKTYGKSGNYVYDTISYKLYDPDGYMVKSGELFLDSLGKGDKFKDDSINIYDISPGKTYKIKFSSRD